MKSIKTVLIGAGYRGMRLLTLLQRICNYEVVAVFDPNEEHPEFDIPFYSDGTEDYKRMIITHSPELVIIASPWKFHIEQALYSVAQGCHVALEVRGGFALGEYYPLMEMAAHKGVNVYPLENTVFMRENMAMLNMVKQGVLGELVAVRGGYRHDLREMLVDKDGKLGNPYMPESVWRSRFYQTENGDLYPTHGLAPLCLAAGINRSDRIAELTSFASKSRGLNDLIKKRGGDVLEITMGDVVVTQLLTQKGVLITLTHDTTLPRPRSFDFEIQGSKGIWKGETRQIYIEGSSPRETWEDDASYVEEYEHPFWKEWGEEAVACDTHHSGMDYIMLRVLAAALCGEVAFPTTIEDLALWTSVSPYSKLSIAEKRTIFID